MRFVILYHQTPQSYERSSHWDLMWENDTGDALTTFAIYGKPMVGEALPAEELAPHRRDYLQYQGPVSENRGHVTRWDEGTIEVLQSSPELIGLQLSGAKLQCHCELRNREDAWTVHFTAVCGS